MDLKKDFFVLWRWKMLEQSSYQDFASGSPRPRFAENRGPARHEDRKLGHGQEKDVYCHT